MPRLTDPDILGFEASVKKNGECYWSAREFSGFLGYADYKSFRRSIEKAIGACVSLGIPIGENFREAMTEIDGQMVSDTKLSRFACYLVAMNADSRKPNVAKAQAYLAGLAESFREYVEAVQDVDRLVIRGDLVDEEKTLAATAQVHQVQNYAFFQNAGYRGMYNMNLAQLKTLKHVPAVGRSPLDFMYSEELAANLFRITQTNAKIRNEQLMGQFALEGAAHEVGSTVRKTIIEISGTPPERLPAAPDLKDARTRLKAAQRTLRKIDAPH